jgi:subtilase family serine protease
LVYRGCGAHPPSETRLGPGVQAFLRALLAFCVTASVATGAAPSPRRQGKDVPDPIEGGRLLRGGPALPASSGVRARDQGSIVILEHDGSNYDQNLPDGTSNYAARAELARRFFETHGDHYDFLVVFSNFEFATPGAQAVYWGVRNDVDGIAIPRFENGPFFGSPGRLRGFVDMAALARYRQAGVFSLTPGDPAFRNTLNVVAHEVGHQWLAHVAYLDGAGERSLGLIGRQDVHWSTLLDSEASVMDGVDWAPNGDGTFTVRRVVDTYSSLDLYLMGLLDPARVPPFALLRNPSFDPTHPFEEGQTIPAQAETITVEQVMAAEGARVPSHQSSPKQFRMGFVFLTGPGVEPSDEDLQDLENVRAAFGGHFFGLTRGVAIADTSLADEPPPAPGSTPDLTRALTWLLAQQSIDGRWEDTPATAIRDTAAAIDALGRVGGQDVPRSRGQAWLLGLSPAPNLDFRARRLGAIATTQPPPFATLLRDQNPDGGFGVASGYESDPWDTALVLRALRAAHHPMTDAVRRAVRVLEPLSRPDGGWSLTPGGEVSPTVTAQALLALQDWSAVSEAAPLLATGLSSLVARQNTDGGFGESASTPYATALALQALMRAGAPQAIVDNAVSWLETHQREDGSWSGSRFDTALVLAALPEANNPNLVVPADALIFEPVSAHEGDTVRVSAEVRNIGRTPAPPSRARLHDGPPEAGGGVAERPVPALAVGGAATITFDFPTDDRPGTRTLYVVADATGEVTEAREDDNAASRALSVAGQLPDLALGALDLDVSPMPPQDGETVTITISVRNRGVRSAAASRARVVLGEPGLGGIALGEVSVPPLTPGTSANVSVAWDTTGRQGAHFLFALVDSRYEVSEADEFNNVVSIPLQVTGPPPPGPDLAPVALSLAPSTLSTIPQAIDIRVRVRNLGRDPAVSTVALHADATGPPAAIQGVAVAPRSFTDVQFSHHVATSGSRTILVIADPDAALPETDETNNRAGALLTDPRNTVDPAVSPGDVVAPGEIIVGQSLAVTAIVRNLGTAPLADLPVLLGHQEDGHVTELARTHVSLSPGAAAPITLTWTSTFTGDPVSLVVQADPFDTLEEVSEGNNTAPVAVRILPSALPNLTVNGGEVSFVPDPPQEGQPATVSAVVRNPGAVPAGNFQVRFYRGDPDHGGAPIGETDVSSVAAGGSAGASIVWAPVDVRGAQGVFVVADPLGQVEEYDETDNRAFRPFNAVGAPDLVLTNGSVELVPRFPRAGQNVTIRAHVRNVGGQTSPAAVVRGFEGEPATGVAIGDGPLPLLAPGEEAVVELAWTPTAPPGERVLSVVADPAQAVSEQDEGNNLARRSVVVQDADLYLTEAYFSPDGDGIQDHTTLAYRTEGPIDVVVSDRLGRPVRTLSEDAPAEGAVEWDGRDDEGVLLPDGAYTFLLRDGDHVRGRTSAVLDLNRSILHDVAGTPFKVVRNLTCHLPDELAQGAFQWMPGEDEVVMIVQTGAGEFAPGMLRVGIDGQLAYVSQDAWFENAFLTSGPAVSPDGREVLVAKEGALHAVDVLTGIPRLVAADSAEASWSPDGRFLVASGRVLARDGSVLATLPHSGEWVWSPDGTRLASGNRTVARDGTGYRVFPLPLDLTDAEGNVAVNLDQTTWRADGRIFLRLGAAPGRESDPSWGLLIDPTTGTVEEIPSFRDPRIHEVVWSPDASRVLHTRTVLGEQAVSETRVSQADGSNSLRLLDARIRTAPHSTVGWSLAETPRGGCAGERPIDVLTIGTLQNLTADLRVIRLAANQGVMLQGTAADQNLDHYQLEYSEPAAPQAWRPIGPASEVPVVDDVFTVWVPPSAGTFHLRLRVVDRAGNVRTTTRTLAWDRVPSIANVTHTEDLISPNGDGRKDSVTFRYLVVEPTRVSVRIAGPRSVSGTLPTVRLMSLEHAETGPASFEWDGRDDEGDVVRDGRYTVLVNDLPFRVEVDSTPPSLAWGYDNLRSEADVLADRVYPFLRAERVWRVVDERLKAWSGGGARGNAQVYEPQRGPDGEVVYDANGMPRILTVGGAPVSRRDPLFAIPGAPESELTGVATRSDGLLVAEDHAGNRASVPILPLPERLLLLGAHFTVHAEDHDVPGDVNTLEGFFERRIERDPRYYGWKRLHTWLTPPIQADVQVFPTRVAEFKSIETVSGDPAVIAQVRDPGGSWTDVTGPALPAGTHRARLVARREGTEVHSEEFLYRSDCSDLLVRILNDANFPPPGPGLDRYEALVRGDFPEPLQSARALVIDPLTRAVVAGFAMEVAPAPEPGSSDPIALRARFVLPAPSCPWQFKVEAVGRSGRVYRNRRDDPQSCHRLLYPAVDPQCGRLRLRQEFRYGEGDPDRVYPLFDGFSTTPGATASVEIGPEPGPLYVEDFSGLPRCFLQGEISGAPTCINEDSLPKLPVPPFDVTGRPQGILDARGRLTIGTAGIELARVAGPLLIDRTVPVFNVLQPAEGEQLCVESGSGQADIARLQVQGLDDGPTLKIAEAVFRQGAGAWQTMVRPSAASTFPSGEAGALPWDVTGLPPGEYTVRLKASDRAGNRATAERRLVLVRDPPELGLHTAPNPYFSPNADGRLDLSTATFRIENAARVAVTVHGPDGLVVRTLGPEAALPPGNHPYSWDGRDDAGVLAGEGSYSIVAQARDACGRVTRRQAGTAVDLTPPEAAVVQPTANQAVGASVDVRGHARDEHFSKYEMAVRPGSGGDWTLLHVGAQVTGPGALLGHWNTPAAPGSYVLRVLAKDVAGNESEAQVAVEVPVRTFIDRVTLVPAVFSPNGDGRRDSTTVEFALLTAARIRLEIRSLQGVVLRTLLTGTDHAAGVHAVGWDGLLGGGAAAPEGELVVHIRAEEPGGGGQGQEETAAVIVDRTSPLVVVQQPAANAYLAREATVRGSIVDARLVSYLISATGEDGVTVELARGAQEPAGATLASLLPLVDRGYVLEVQAEDAAENRAEVGVPFTIDSLDPIVSLHGPAEGAVLAIGATPVVVRGMVIDTHLQGFALAYGPGAQPAFFNPVANGTAGGADIVLGAWDVSALPEGLYTLMVVGTDRAGHEAEARRTVFLDGAAPAAIISSPAEGARLRVPGPVRGTASDAQLDSWTLDAAPGPAASAFQWTQLGAGAATVDAGELVVWDPLPPDGVHTLRLKVKDRVGRIATTLRTVTIDTTPPRAPAGLTADVVRTPPDAAEIRLAWEPLGDGDLAGYLVFRDGVQLTPAPIVAVASIDAGRPDGSYVYSVRAVDVAGNQGAPAVVTAWVDLTPPLVDIQRPAGAAVVSGTVSVRGTAFSPTDFKEYRLLVGSGAEPETWTLLRRSTVAVAGGALGSWEAAEGGPYVFALEAEDVSGNRARVTVSFIVDNQAPSAPVLTSVVAAPDAASLTSSWSPSPELDVAGYLVYRNGRLANGPDVVVGDLRPYLVPPPSHASRDLADGSHCFRLTAMDNAGNLSPPSNEVCRSLDNRAPAAVIRQPADGHRFEAPLHVVADTPDTDVTAVQFQLKPQVDTTWSNLGPPDGVPPFEASVDPQNLPGQGRYDIRGVATDQGGRSDPSPAAITIVHGDTTPPGSPRDLMVRVDGRTATLTWTTNTEADLSGYHVFRAGRRLTSVPVAAVTYGDGDLPEGLHSYAVTAVDEEGNESLPGAVAQGLVYKPRLAPVYPVTVSAAVDVAGSHAISGTDIDILRGGAVAGSGPAPATEFVVADVPLVPEANLLSARGRDPAGNRSVPSDEMVLIANTAPPALTGLAGTTGGQEVLLTWPPVHAPDLFGYVVRRGDVSLSPSVLQTEAASIFASHASGSAPAAFDRNPNSSWEPGPGAISPTWTIGFPAPVLIDRISLRFPSPLSVTAYRVEAAWEGRFIPLARIAANDRAMVAHDLQYAFATDAIRVVLQGGAQPALAEVTISRIAVVPAAGVPSFQDVLVPQGLRQYSVAAIDRYGLQGPAASVDVPVGDVSPPAPPTGLQGSASGSDVSLSWNSSPEPDVVRYIVRRGVGVIADVPSPAYQDPRRPSGVHVYTVAALDASGLESGPSAPVSVTVLPRAPAAPQILLPTDAAHPITLTATRTDVRGRAEAGTLVTLFADETLQGSALAAPAFVESASVGTPDAIQVAVSPDGGRVAYTVGTGGSVAIRVVNRMTGAIQEVTHAGYDLTSTPVFSPEGTRLAYVASRPDAVDLYVVELATGERRPIEDGADVPSEISWSADGLRLAVASMEGRLSVYDWTGGTAVVVFDRSGSRVRFPRFSPSGVHLAFVTVDSTDARTEVRVLDLAAEAQVLLEEQAWEGAPSWSPDGARLAVTSNSTAHLRVLSRSIPGGQVNDLTDGAADAFDPRYDQTGHWLSYSETTVDPVGRPAHGLVALRLDTGVRLPVSPVPSGGPPSPAQPLHEWVAGPSLALGLPERVTFLTPEDGFFAVADVPLQPGENRFKARSTDITSGLVSPDSPTVRITVPPASFPDLSVQGDEASTYPALPVVGDAAVVSSRVRNRGAAEARQVPVELSVTDGAGLRVFSTTATLSSLAAGGSAVVSGLWVPAAAGPYSIRVVVDSGNGIAESREDNNLADQGVQVVSGEGVFVGARTDRGTYSAHMDATVTVELVNSGPDVAGVARVTVEDLSGTEVALLESRPVAVSYGQTLSYALVWNTGTTYAGEYSFRVRLQDSSGVSLGAASATFRILGQLQVGVRLRAARTVVPLGEPAQFEARVQNLATNTPLEGLRARLRILPPGGGAPVFESEAAVPPLLPGGLWEGTLAWPIAAPVGAYRAELSAISAGDSLAADVAGFTVASTETRVTGTLVLEPSHALPGGDVSAQVTVDNPGGPPRPGFVVTVEVTTGADPAVILRRTLVVDLPAGGTATATLTLPTAGWIPRAHVVFLRAEAPRRTLDRTVLWIHAPIVAPSVDSPASGSTVATSHPQLVVNNGVSGDGADLVYEFQLFADAELTRPMPGESGVPQGASRTSWRVPVNLSEDRTYYWRARATDAFSASAWTEVASFTVDATDLPPTVPLPDSPPPGARVASREPFLTVANALDPELRGLTYSFRLATDAAMSTVLVSAADLPEGPGLTTWLTPMTLEENGTYFWSVRASDGRNMSAWSEPVSFMVDTENEPPSAPGLISPVGGSVPTLEPELRLDAAVDPEGEALTYQFEIDRVPSFDSPHLQVSGAQAGLAWVPSALADNTRHHWRAAATDGTTRGPWAPTSFFVNLTNDVPGTAVPLAPPAGGIVTTATPTLVVLNAVDADGDELTYEFVVRDQAGTVVVEATGVPEGAPDTAWSVPERLAENASFTWTARAHDGQAFGEWTAPQDFQVNVLPDPPTMPMLVSPADGAMVEVAQPTLIVSNAASPEGLPLTYTFEVYRRAADGTLTLVGDATGVAEGAETTSWTLMDPLDEGTYSWRARATDLNQSGPWMSTAGFRVALDSAPAPPTGVAAIPGDRQVTLAWSTHPETDVTGYRIRRSLTGGGPYAVVATTVHPSYTDTGLANGVTVHYVVTATDQHFESAPSAEVSATPQPPRLAAQVRFSPTSVKAECLLPECAEDDVAGGSQRDGDGDDCPRWLYATIELPPGNHPASILLSTVRLAGSVSPDPSFSQIVDSDGDGLPERKVRFLVTSARPYLTPGPNTPSVSGRAGTVDFLGQGALHVDPLRVELWMTPRTLQRTSNGQAVQGRLTFEGRARGSEVDMVTVRLNGVVPVDRVVSISGRRLTVKFNRAAVIAVLPLGQSVEVRVTGLLRGVPFSAVDRIRVVP